MHAGGTYHIALTYDGSTVRLFLNGSLQASVGASGPIKQLACEDFLVGPLANGWMESDLQQRHDERLGRLDPDLIERSLYEQFHRTDVQSCERWQHSAAVEFRQTTSINSRRRRLPMGLHICSCAALVAASDRFRSWSSAILV